MATNQQHQMLLPSWIDHLATSEPQTLWGEYPVAPDSLEAGFAPITYASFANAVNGVAHYLQRALPGGPDGETLAYLAPNDARCTIALVAAMKAGYKLFLTSERNTVAANMKLLDELHCTTLVTTDPEMAAVRQLLSELNVHMIVLPPLKTLLHEAHQPYEYSKIFSNVQDETAFVVHTSGSTGLPKSMSITHRYIARAVNNIQISAPDGYTTISDLTGNNRNILLLPLGHPAGVHFGLLNPFFNRNTVILPRPNVPPTAETLLEMLKHTKVDWATLAPLTLETLAKNMPLLDEIAPRLSMMLFSGGSLPKVFGDVLATRMKLTSLLGSSESGPLPTIYRSDFDFSVDWNYLQIHPAMNATFDPLPGDVAELVFKRSPESEPHQTVFTLYPNLAEFRTRDLFTRHPDHPDLWTHASRSDDVIVFLNGEKLNPVTFESYVSQHSDISGVIMFGAQRFEAGLLIETGRQNPMNAHEMAHAIVDIWPTIEEANHLVPGYAQVSQSHIYFTDPDLPILRTLKGTVRRKETLELYGEKIDRMYTNAEQGRRPLPRTVTDVTEETIRSALEAYVKKTLQLENVSDTRDLFQLGLDSLQALRLAQELSLNATPVTVQPSMIYLHPTIDRLSKAIVKSAYSIETDKVEVEKSRYEVIESTLKEFSKKIDQARPVTSTPKEPRIPTNQVVLLTGSTGFIGAYLLDALMKNASVSHVYCLNRSSDSADAQAQRNAQNDPNLATTFAEATFLTADLSDNDTMGLSSTIYDELAQKVTLIVHNAWLVNFNLPLTSFQSMLDSIVSLINLATNATQKPRFLFMSSVSTAFNLKNSGTIHEEILNDSSAPVAGGYAESKHIAERLVDYAAHNLSLGSCKVLRLGQIAGPKHSAGKWNDKDWLPALIKSSKYLGMIPETLSMNRDDSIDWLPVDEAAAAILEIAFSDDAQPSREAYVYHVLNPSLTRWRELLPYVTQSLDSLHHDDQTQSPTSTKIQIVAPEVWLTKLRASGNRQMSDAMVNENPALRLVGVWADILGDNGTAAPRRWSTKRSAQASPTLASAKKVEGPSMVSWMRGWFERGVQKLST